MMTNGDREGRIFLYYPHTNNEFFFLLTIAFIYLFQNKHPEVPEYAKMQFHMMTLLDVLGKIALGKIRFLGAQWLSGRVLDSRPRGRGFGPHRRHCVVVLEQDTFIPA